LMVNEYVDLTQPYKERKSHNVEALLEIRKRELQLRKEEFKIRQMEQRRQDLQFYLQHTDHLSGLHLKTALDMKLAIDGRWDSTY
ncbi:hypothetical protein Tco_0372840, partial [Tanacetum coccineum]